MTKLTKFLLAATAAIASPALAAPAGLPDADPALWVVKDPDTTIYLFGTFHGLDNKADWFNDEVKAAFDKSDELVIEAILPENPAELQPLVMKYGIDTSGKTLTEKLSPKGRENLAKALKELGAPANAFDKFKPAFASTVIASAVAAKMGLTPKHGSEAILRDAAKAANKPLSALETAEFQLAMLTGFPEATSIEMLEQILGSMDEVPKLFARMRDTWYQGDAPGFVKILEEAEAQSPETHKVVFADRNATWAEWIDQRLDKPGTVFMAVGTGHLAGKDSVQQLLAKRSIKSARVAQ